MNFTYLRTLNERINMCYVLESHIILPTLYLINEADLCFFDSIFSVLQSRLDDASQRSVIQLPKFSDPSFRPLISAGVDTVRWAADKIFQPFSISNSPAPPREDCR